MPGHLSVRVQIPETSRIKECTYKKRKEVQKNPQKKKGDEENIV